MSEQLTEKQVRAFLRDLFKLAKKHNIGIGGCGCCGSPYLHPVTKALGYAVTKENYDELACVEKREQLDRLRKTHLAIIPGEDND